MGACNDCGKETSILFADENRELCWLCNSRSKMESSGEGVESIKEDHDERRAWQRYSVQIHMKFYYGESEKSKVIFPGTTVNLSEGGLCVEWTPCEQCSGYQAGAVHPQCIFNRYAYSTADGEALNVSLFLDDEDIIDLNARVVFVIKKEDGLEYLGLAFTELEPHTRERVSSIITALLGNG